MKPYQTPEATDAQNEIKFIRRMYQERQAGLDAYLTPDEYNLRLCIIGLAAIFIAATVAVLFILSN